MKTSARLATQGVRFTPSVSIQSAATNANVNRVSRVTVSLATTKMSALKACTTATSPTHSVSILQAVTSAPVLLVTQVTMPVDATTRTSVLMVQRSVL